MKAKLFTAMKLIGQYVGAALGVTAMSVMLVCALTWEFIRALFEVVVLGKTEADLL